MNFGKYQVESLIAAGGMAEVFLAATPPPVVRRVAIKRIKPQFATQENFLTMFVDEARVAVGFDHLNVVRTLDFEAGPPPYLVMELIDGPDLRRIIWESATKKKWVPFDLAAAIIAQAARGLHYAHNWKDASGEPLGIIHRDMSPQNIMLTRAGVAKVVDFGIAKAAGRNTVTRAGIIKGKYAYMAPEQVRGETLSPRTDVFSLGILLYESLTYINPFRRDRDERTLIAVTDEAPADPTKGRPELPSDLVEIVLEALAKDPGERYQSALELAEAIDASIATRRSPVTEAHLSEFLVELAAIPMPDAAATETKEKDSEVSVAELEKARTQFEMRAVSQEEAEAAAGMAAPTVRPKATDEPSEHAALRRATTVLQPQTPGPAPVKYVTSPAMERPSNLELGGDLDEAEPPRPAAVQSRWQGPVMIVLGLVLLGALVGAGLGLVQSSRSRSNAQAPVEVTGQP